MTNINFLDCSLRDGGYYNNWEFSIDEAQEYINSLSKAGVKYIEIGFRFCTKNKFMGPFAYTRESLINKLDIPSNVTLGVMINASDFISDEGFNQLKDIFPQKDQSKVSLVRIAAHMKQVPECERMVKLFKSLGYICGFNIMQISEADDKTVADLVKHVESNFGDFDALYFADSLGKMTPQDIHRIVTIFKNNSNKEIGFHGHDNMGYGVANSIQAIESGASWVDATVTGIGRGAGNTQTEYLLNALNTRFKTTFNTLHANSLALGWVGKLKDKCKWGTNILYYEAAMRSIHPTYVQEMIASPQFSDMDIMNMIFALNDLPNPTSFNKNNIDIAFAKNFTDKNGKTQVSNQNSNSPIILLGKSDSIIKHKDAIIQFAKKQNAQIISLNAPMKEWENDVDIIGSIHPARLSNIISANINYKTLITTISGVRDEIISSLKEKNIIDYGIKYSQDVEDKIEFHETGITTSVPNILSYLLGYAVSSGAQNVYLAGLDGYDGLSKQFIETNDILTKASENTNIKLLTESFYNLDIENIYGE